MKQLRELFIICTILNGNLRDKDVIIPRIPLTSTDERYIPFTRLQIPVKLAFAVTKNRSQGQSFGKVGLYLKYDVFSHGQLYVGMSHVTDPSNLMIYLGKDKSKNFTKNEVYPEVLQ